MPRTAIKIKCYPIRLGQFLKLADIVSDGLEAKALIAGGEVLVNNIMETRRGRQLARGDTIIVQEREFICT